MSPLPTEEGRGGDDVVGPMVPTVVCRYCMPFMRSRCDPLRLLAARFCIF